MWKRPAQIAIGSVLLLIATLTWLSTVADGSVTWWDALGLINGAILVSVGYVFLRGDDDSPESDPEDEDAPDF